MKCSSHQKRYIILCQWDIYDISRKTHSRQRCFVEDRFRIFLINETCYISNEIYILCQMWCIISILCQMWCIMSPDACFMSGTTQCRERCSKISETEEMCSLKRNVFCVKWHVLYFKRNEFRVRNICRVKRDVLCHNTRITCLERRFTALYDIHENALQHAATRCTTLQHTATHCNTL